MDPALIPIFESFGISLYEGYGITECSPLVAVTPYWKRKPGTVGPAVPCCEIRIEGTETNDLGFLSGEVQVKGDNVMLGYMNNDEANEAAFTEDKNCTNKLKKKHRAKKALVNNRTYAPSFSDVFLNYKFNDRLLV